MRVEVRSWLMRCIYWERSSHSILILILILLAENLETFLEFQLFQLKGASWLFVGVDLDQIKAKCHVQCKHLSQLELLWCHFWKSATLNQTHFINIWQVKRHHSSSKREVPVIATETPRPRRHKVGGDLSQGPAVDAVDVAQFRGLQIIGLSATLPNVQLLADSSTAPKKKALWWLMCPLFQCQYQADKLQRSRCTQSLVHESCLFVRLVCLDSFWFMIYYVGLCWLGGLAWCTALRLPWATCASYNVSSTEASGELARQWSCLGKMIFPFELRQESIGNQSKPF